MACFQTCKSLGDGCKVRVSLILAVLLVASERPAIGCLGCYCSWDYLVGRSPLIVVGEITKVTPLPLHTRRPGSNEEPGPAIATLRVLQVLKGHYEQTGMQLRNGPIASCSPDPVYYGLTEGQRSIFVLPLYPEEGISCLVYGGSVLELSDLTRVESRLDRARSFRADYLNGIKADTPQVYAAAATLADEMRTSSVKWPALTSEEAIAAINPDMSSSDDKAFDRYRKKTSEGPFKTAVQAVVDRLAREDVETIRAAQALDWLRDDPRCWWRSAVWGHALGESRQTHEKGALEAERRRIRLVLSSHGVEKKLVEQYTSTISSERDVDGSLDFPPDCPNAYRHQGKEENSEDLTTEFILRYYAYDRGSMFVAYGMRFDVLANLNPARVGTLIEALYGSDDPQLRLVALRAIERIPGDSFVGLVLDDLVETRRNVHAWRALIHEHDEEGTAQGLRKLVDTAHKRFTDWGIGDFWDALRAGECFHVVCLNEAICRVEEQEGKTPAADHYQNAALQRYLAAAVTAKAGTITQSMTAAQYREALKGGVQTAPED